MYDPVVFTFTYALGYLRRHRDHGEIAILSSIAEKPSLVKSNGSKLEQKRCRSSGTQKPFFLILALQDQQEGYCRGLNR